MPNPTPAAAAIFTAETAAVLAVLQRPTWRSKFHTSRDVASAVNCTTIRALAALKRLRAEGKVESDAGHAVAGNNPSKLMTLWRLTEDDTGRVSRRNPVCASRMPNGSPQFWGAFTAQMNTPVRGAIRAAGRKHDLRHLTEQAGPVTLH